MNARSDRARRSALLIAKVLAVVLLAVSPRALLAPTTSFNRALESKRPKVPKNVVRSDPFQVSNLEKQGISPPPAKSEMSSQAMAAGFLPSPLLHPLVVRAHVQLSKPDYLKLFSASSRQNHLDPPV